ncbi:MAG TPA: FCD domain-containing protein [Acidimicrobiales bacterium]|nr:FCD domain-containing protein [Acidimicrobiales bacterium]
MRVDDAGDAGAARPGTAAIPQRRTEKISEIVAREIVHDMRSMAPGAKLPSEAAMLEKYRVGRASLREALRLLEVQGLIVIRPGPGGGPVVAAVDSRHFARMASLYFHLSGATYRDLAEARLVMEPVMARLAAERQDPDDLAKLERFIQETPDSTNQPEYFRHSTEFHAVLSGMSGNPVLDLMGRSLKDLYADRLEELIFPVDARVRVQQEHATIARAIVKGNAARAEKLMREHMVEFVDFAVSRSPAMFSEIVDWR